MLIPALTADLIECDLGAGKHVQAVVHDHPETSSLSSRSGPLFDYVNRGRELFANMVVPNIYNFSRISLSFDNGRPSCLQDRERADRFDHDGSDVYGAKGTSTNELLDISL